MNRAWIAFADAGKRGCKAGWIGPKDVLPIRAGAHESMQKEQRIPFAAQVVPNLAAVDVDMHRARLSEHCAPVRCARLSPSGSRPTSLAYRLVGWDHPPQARAFNQPDFSFDIASAWRPTNRLAQTGNAYNGASNAVGHGQLNVT